MVLKHPLFQTILNRIRAKQILASPNSAIGFIHKHFYWPYQYHWDIKLNENIIHDLLLK